MDGGALWQSDIRQGSEGVVGIVCRPVWCDLLDEIPVIVVAVGATEDCLRLRSPDPYTCLTPILAILRLLTPMSCIVGAAFYFQKFEMFFYLVIICDITVSVFI